MRTTTTVSTTSGASATFFSAGIGNQRFAEADKRKQAGS